MSLFFVADIHLNESEPAITAGFISFLQNLPENSQLYILGDLFDYWVGDDAISALHQTIANELAELAKRNITSYFIHGNRDFLLGNHYAQRCHMKILPAVVTIEHNQQRIVILHGDLLCTDDKSYQRFRRYMHNRFLQRVFLLLPLCLRNRIANRLRQKSEQHNQKKSNYIMDVNQYTVCELIEQYQADIMIHGHTHKPGIHSFSCENRDKQRFVLGAWHDHCDYVVCNEQIELKPLKIR